MIEPGLTVAVEVDLHLSLDGQAVTLTGSGSDLVLHCSSPRAALDQLAAVALPVAAGNIGGARSAGQAADLLNSLGLRLTVTGAAGSVVTLGRGQKSLIGRLITRSAHVSLGRPAAVGPLVLMYLRRAFANHVPRPSHRIR